MYRGSGVYVNHKGKYYYVTGLVKHSETSEVFVAYFPMYLTESGIQSTVRPFDSFDGRTTEGTERFVLVRSAT